MSGVTDTAFRELCCKFGAGLGVAGFFNTTALIRNNTLTSKMLTVSPLEKNSCGQLFGSSPQDLLDASKKLPYKIIDLNLGCPALKIINQNAGSELMKNSSLVKEIVSTLVDNQKKPVTVKMRLGINDKLKNYLEISKICADAGASAITLHARTRKQGYSGKANWSAIKLLKKSIDIPVIGNGDVKTPEDAKRMLEETNCDYVMIGRTAWNNPQIFQQVNAYLKNGEIIPNLTLSEKIDFLYKYYDLLKKYDMNHQAIKIVSAQHFINGYKKSSAIRLKLNGVKTQEEIETILNDYKKTYKP